MPFSRSRSLESMTRSLTSWFSRNEPDCQSIASTSVVFPWSTWATMATLRRSSRRLRMGSDTAQQGSRAARGQVARENRPVKFELLAASGGKPAENQFVAPEGLEYPVPVGGQRIPLVVLVGCDRTRWHTETLFTGRAGR